MLLSKVAAISKSFQRMKTITILSILRKTLGDNIRVVIEKGQYISWKEDIIDIK